MFPALTDFTFIESKKGKMFVNSPNALEGNHIDKCDTSDAAFQSSETGLIERSWPTKMRSLRRSVS